MSGESSMLQLEGSSARHCSNCTAQRKPRTSTSTVAIVPPPAVSHRPHQEEGRAVHPRPPGSLPAASARREILQIAEQATIVNEHPTDSLLSCSTFCSHTDLILTCHYVRTKLQQQLRV